MVPARSAGVAMNVRSFTALERSSPELRTRQRRARTSRVEKICVAREARVDRDAVVVGGGPAGLASAMMLARRGWRKVTVLEQQEEIAKFSPTLGFVYSIDGRGQRGLRQHVDDALLDVLKAKCAASSSVIDMKVFNPDGTQGQNTIKGSTANFWIARHRFVQMLYDTALEKYSDVIEVRTGILCKGLETTNQEAGDYASSLSVITENAVGQREALAADLVVGADGLNSGVRQWLAKEEPDVYKTRRMHSGSSGMLYKVLSVPAGFSLPGGYTFPPKRNETVQLCAIAGALKGWDTELRLGLLPTAEDDDMCSANIIRVPEHKVWQMKTGEELICFLEKSFPQLSVREVIPKEEAERWVKARPGVFPSPQYCAKLHKVVDRHGSGKGVVLLGDAAHAFPPDLGQGVNGALTDIESLSNALEESGDNIARAVELYGTERLPQSEALVRLMQIGYPWQYKQNAFRTFLWRINVVFRLVLNKVAPQLFDKQVFLMVLETDNSYSEILNKANRTTRNIAASAAVAAAVLFFLLRAVVTGAT